MLSEQNLRESIKCEYNEITCKDCSNSSPGACDANRVELARTALALLDMVKKCIAKSYCPICNIWINTGHSPDCELGNLLKEIGGGEK